MSSQKTLCSLQSPANSSSLASFCYEEKKSRFVACLSGISAPEDVQIFLEKQKELHPAARHHVLAWIMQQDVYGYSDDGEPTKTAGWPIYQVLEGSGLIQVACVVSRYFGGTLLGCGGLVRAYRSAAQGALADAKKSGLIRELRELSELQLSFAFSELGTIEQLLKQLDAQIIERHFSDHVDFKLWIPSENIQRLTICFRDYTRGQGSYQLYRDFLG